MSRRPSQISLILDQREIGFLARFLCTRMEFSCFIAENYFRDFVSSLTDVEVFEGVECYKAMYAFEKFVFSY